MRFSINIVTLIIVMKKAQKLRLGIFILVSSLLLILLILYFAAQALFERKDHYYVAYRDISVSGLEVGSPVKFLGINVGSIAEIGIAPDDVNLIIVKLALQEDTPVKVDAVADIVAMGITGLKTIEIRGGTQEADFLSPGGYIQPGTSLTEDITGKAEVIAFKAEQVLNNLQLFTDPDNMAAFTETAERITDFANQANQTVLSIGNVVNENREDIRQTMATITKISNKLEKTSGDLTLAMSRFNEIMQGDTLGELLGNFRDISHTLKEANLNELIEELAEATRETQYLMLRVGDDVDRGAESLTENLLLLQNTLINLNEASRKISADPSVLVRRPRLEGTPDRLLDNN